MKKQFHFAVEYIRLDLSNGSVLGTAETREKALAEIAKYIEYYHGMNYRINREKTTLNECCADCSGTGQVASKRRKKVSHVAFQAMKVCSSCKGKNSTIQVEIDFNLETS